MYIFFFFFFRFWFQFRKEFCLLFTDLSLSNPIADHFHFYISPTPPFLCLRFFYRLLLNVRRSFKFLVASAGLIPFQHIFSLSLFNTFFCFYLFFFCISLHSFILFLFPSLSSRSLFISLFFLFSQLLVSLLPFHSFSLSFSLFIFLLLPSVSMTGCPRFWKAPCLEGLVALNSHLISRGTRTYDR